MKKRIISLLLVIVLSMAFTISAEETYDGAISVTEAKGFRGQTVKVDILVDENPGIIAAVMTVKYDDTVLTLKRVEDKSKLGENNHSDNLLTDEYYIAWFNPLSEIDYTYEGAILTLTFEIAEDAELGNYSVDLTVGEAYDAELSAVSFAETDGKISVVEVPKFITGDVDMDGEVKLADAVLLFRHSLNSLLYPIEYGGTLDFNGDGVLNMEDIVKVFRHSLNPELYPLD